jgi:hypothetical protein
VNSVDVPAFVADARAPLPPRGFAAAFDAAVFALGLAID